MVNKTPLEQYEAWFGHIQALHASNPDRHPNTATYDNTLKANYPWVFFNLRQTDTPQVLHDIGCAYGSMSLGAYALGYQVYATDILDTWVNRMGLADRGIYFTQNNIEKKPLVGQTLHDGTVVPKADVVLFTEVLEHLNDNPVKALSNIREGMKPGGLLILSTPRRECGKHAPGLYQGPHINCNTWEEIPNNSREWVDAHTYIYTESELRHLLTVCNFGILTQGLAWNGITTGLVAYNLG